MGNAFNSVSSVITDSKKRLNIGRLYDLSLVLFLCFPSVVYVLRFVLRPFGIESMASMFALLLVYLPVLLGLTKKKKIEIDFCIIWFVVVFFFLITLAVHPEYLPWYSRKEYGVLEYVLRPDNGLYIYLLIRLVNDPNRIIKCIRISSLPMYVYYVIQIRKALSVGYWIDTSNRGYEIHLSYNLSIGYNVLLFTLTFLFCAFKEKKMIDWIGAAAGVAIILVAGSRGPILDIIIFVVIYYIIKLKDRKKRMIKIAGISGVGLLLYYIYPYLLSACSWVLDRFNLSSRFIEKLVNGSIADDSGRLTIWKAAVEMINENPLGYGAMGSRHVLNKYIYVAHPHNFFLEVFIDFGVIIGAVIIVLLFYWTIKLFSVKDNDAWRGVFLIFFSRGCQLLVSLTFWHSISLWGCLAVGVCMWKDCKKRRTNQCQIIERKML